MANASLEACAAFPGTSSEYYTRLMRHVGARVGRSRPNAIVLAFSGLHYVKEGVSMKSANAQAALSNRLMRHVEFQLASVRRVSRLHEF